MSKKFAPTADQRGNVEAMTGFAIPQEAICRVIINPETGKPIDTKTLQLHFADEIETGRTKANATVGRFIYATITGAPGGVDYPPGRIDLAKFWASTQMGWKSTSVHQHEGITDGGASVAQKLISAFDRLAAEGPVAGENSGDDAGGKGGTGT